MAKKLIITNIPAFYKVNLFNEINKQIDIEVIFTGTKDKTVFKGKEIVRKRDFLDEKIFFKVHYLSGSFLTKLWQLLTILRNVEYTEIIIDGWDSILIWVILCFDFTKRKSLIVESTNKESTTKGIKGFLKKVFLKRICKVYASGISQEKLVRQLGFKGECVITKGVGIYNRKYDKAPLKQRDKVTNFLYVGRLSEEKNLMFMIEGFKNNPHLTLRIVGYGDLEEKIRCTKPDNVFLLGAINNKEITDEYNANDVLLLLSYSETWGIVVEEALNNGLPVILSKNVGCAEELQIDNNYGLLIDDTNIESYEKALDKMQNIEIYKRFCKNIQKIDFKKIEENQVLKYL